MDALENAAYGFGFFAVLLPAAAAVVGVIGVVTGLVTAIEALITFALMALMLAAMLHDRLEFVYRAIIYGTAEVVVWLAPVPVLGNLAELLGGWIILWLPSLVLAVISWLI